jgi:hypothetical protein
MTTKEKRCTPWGAHLFSFCDFQMLDEPPRSLRPGLFRRSGLRVRFPEELVQLMAGTTTWVMDEWDDR